MPPNCVSTRRYHESSTRWKKTIADWQLATFQTDYDPYRNPWLV